MGRSMKDIHEMQSSFKWLQNITSAIFCHYFSFTVKVCVCVYLLKQYFNIVRPQAWVE